MSSAVFDAVAPIGRKRKKNRDGDLSCTASMLCWMPCCAGDDGPWVSDPRDVYIQAVVESWEIGAVVQWIEGPGAEGGAFFCATGSSPLMGLFF